MSDLGRWSTWNSMKGSGDQAEGDNKASNNPQPAPSRKILRLRLSVGQKKEWLRWISRWDLGAGGRC